MLRKLSRKLRSQNVAQQRSGKPVELIGGGATTNVFGRVRKHRSCVRVRDSSSPACCRRRCGRPAPPRPAACLVAGVGEDGRQAGGGGKSYRLLFWFGEPAHKQCASSQRSRSGRPGPTAKRTDQRADQIAPGRPGRVPARMLLTRRRPFVRAESQRLLPALESVLLNRLKSCGDDERTRTIGAASCPLLCRRRCSGVARARLFAGELRRTCALSFSFVAITRAVGRSAGATHDNWPD
jgi:hypothetical protein